VADEEQTCMQEMAALVKSSKIVALMWDFQAIERSPMIAIRLTSPRSRGDAGEAPEWNPTAANTPIFPIVERISRCAPEFAGWKLQTGDPTAKQENISNRSRWAGSRMFPESVETGEV
jgi:hypothetical protein